MLSVSHTVALSCATAASCCTSLPSMITSVDTGRSSLPTPDGVFRLGAGKTRMRGLIAEVLVGASRLRARRAWFVFIMHHDLPGRAARERPGSVLRPQARKGQRIVRRTLGGPVAGSVACKICIWETAFLAAFGNAYSTVSGPTSISTAPLPLCRPATMSDPLSVAFQGTRSTDCNSMQQWKMDCSL